MVDILLLGGPKCGHVVHAEATRPYLEFTTSDYRHVYHVGTLKYHGKAHVVGRYTSTSSEQALKLAEDYLR
jgi:hypothetical protein